jgi:hypothetical protein
MFKIELDSGDAVLALKTCIGAEHAQVWAEEDFFLAGGGWIALFH